MTARTSTWYARQLAHARECIAQADRVHTPAEIEAARTALSAAFQTPQCKLFSAPPHAGLIPGGQPETPGLADRGVAE